MHRPFVSTVLVLLLACCTPRTTTSDVSATVGPPSASPLPELPAGLPPSFGDDVGPGDVPAAALIPLKAEVTGHWEAPTSAGDAIVVAWESPGSDPIRPDRGIAAWRRFADGGAPWRPVWGADYPSRRDPLVNLTTQIADVTGDGSADALVLAETGGSGACGTSTVIDLATGDAVYRSTGCDRTVTPSSDPVGLEIREAVYAPGDAHCCPSSVRTTVETYDGADWVTATATTSPA